MPITKVDHVELPYAGRRHTPDYSRLAALYSRGGETLADLSVQRGQHSARLFERLGALFSGYQEMEQQKKATATAAALRDRDRSDRLSETAAERAERAAERKAIAEEKKVAAAEKRGAATSEEVGYGPMSEGQMSDVLAGPSAGRARYVFGPGTADGPELQPTQPQQRSIRAEDDIRKLGGTIGPNGQVIMPSKPAASKSLQLQPAMVNGRRSFAVFDPETGQATDFAGRPVDAQPIPPQGPSQSEPLVPLVGPDGKTRYGTRAEARGQIVPAGASKPATGLEKRALNFFNRAQQADVDLESMEADILKMGLGGQTRMEYAPNFLQSDVGQRYLQSQRAFTEARLRKDSGAAIPPQEFTNDRRTYFPQPGDTQATLAQKRRSRAAILSSLGFESGQALGEYMGDAEEAATIIKGYRDRSESRVDGTKIGDFIVREKK